MKTTTNKVMQKLAKGVVAASVATAIVATPVAMVSQQAAAEIAGAEVTITAVVDAVEIKVTQINGIDFSTSGGDAESIVVATYNAKNEIHFKTDEDAHVRIMLGGKVMWEGDTKAGQPVTAVIDMTDFPVGIYNLQIQAYRPGEPDHVTTSTFHLDYRATIPSIIPDAPNTGMYVTVGGRVYSMSTVAIVALLIAVVVFMLATRGKHATAPAKTTKKTTRKKMDLI